MQLTNTQLQIDPTALALSRSIRSAEGGDYNNRSGDAGTSAGAYQFNNGKIPLKPGEIPANFKSWASELNLDPNDFSETNQDHVVYERIKKKLDAGQSQSSIAAEWNSGLKNNWETHKGSTTINGKTISYDTPAYVAKVQKFYQDQLNGKTQTPQTPDVSQETQPDNRDFLQKAGDVVNSIFPGGDIGKAFGNSISGIYQGIKQGSMQPIYEAGQENAKNYGKIVGDVGQTVLTAGSMALPGAGSVLGRIGQAGLLGAGIGGTQALKEGKTNLGDIGKQTAIGGVTGGVLSGAGEVITKAAQTLPQWISRKFITGKGIGDKEIQYAIDKGLGSPKTMLSQSDTSIDTLGNKLGSILKSPQYKDFTVPGRDILNKVTQDFPDAGLSRVDIVKKLESIVPLKKNLVTNLLKGNLSLDELHTLNSALGKNTFKTVFDGTEVKANKEIGSAVYHTISDIIKNVAPESVPVFESLSKEYPLNSALQGLIRRGEVSKSITLKEIMSFLGGSTFGGPLAGLSAVGAEKLATSPTVNLKTAGLISKLAKPTAQGIGKVTKPLLMKQLQGLFGGNVNVQQ